MNDDNTDIKLEIAKAFKTAKVSEDLPIKIKLIISEISQSEQHIFNPILSQYNIQPGNLHFALIVGPWYLEW